VWALVPPLRQRLLDDAATSRANLRRITGVNLDNLTASLCRFALQDVDEETPARIADALGKVVVLEHSLYIKVFDGNESVTIDQGTRYFVSHIATLIGNMHMRLRKQSQSVSFSFFSCSLFGYSLYLYALSITLRLLPDCVYTVLMPGLARCECGSTEQIVKLWRQTDGEVDIPLLSHDNHLYS